MIKRIIVFICLPALICAHITHDIIGISALTNKLAARDSVQDPNNVTRKIVMPKAIEAPAKYKCPVHGITDITVVLEVDEIRKIYCKKCAITLVCDFFDLNLPKLEVVK